MHCWAAVSHYVDYKGDWDVPANLKMALSALSGLFYVADSEFEQFNAAMIASKKSAEQVSLAKGEMQDVNLDTVAALLRKTYPNRSRASPNGISKLVHEIKSAGYRSLDELQRDLESGAKSVTDYEKEHEGGRVYFIDIGAARHALAGVSERFAEVRRKEDERELRKKSKGSGKRRSRPAASDN
jgi:putative GTP pyrophosphokinase